jgi:hypothetical protein
MDEWTVGLRPAQDFFHFYGDVTITGILKGCTINRLMAFEQGDLYRATSAVTQNSVFPVSSEGPPHSVASLYDTQGGVEDLF